MYFYTLEQESPIIEFVGRWEVYLMKFRREPRQVVTAHSVLPKDATYRLLTCSDFTSMLPNASRVPNLDFINRNIELNGVIQAVA